MVLEAEYPIISKRELRESGVTTPSAFLSQEWGEKVIVTHFDYDFLKQIYRVFAYHTESSVKE